RLVPREVSPEVEVLLGVARRLRELAGEALDQAIDFGIELVRRDRAIDEPPLLRLPGRDWLTQEDDLARAAVADHDRQPLRGAPPRNRSVLRPDVTDERVVHHDREVARHLQLVAAADADPVDPRDRRLADLPETVVRILERAEPLPVLGRLADVAL